MSQNFEPSSEQRRQFLRSLGEVVNHLRQSAGFGGLFSALINPLLDATTPQGPGEIPRHDLRALDRHTLIEANNPALSLGGLTLNRPDSSSGSHGADRIVVQDPERFLALLSRIDSISNEPPSVVRGLDVLVHAAARNIEEAAKRHPETYKIDVDVYFERAISEEAKRLTLPSASYLTTRLDGFDREYLVEQLLLERSKLTGKRGNFSPAEWHRDTTVEQYQERWKGVLDVIYTFVASDKDLVCNGMAPFAIKVAREAARDAAVEIGSAQRGTAVAEMASELIKVLNTALRGLDYFESELNSK